MQLIGSREKAHKYAFDNGKKFATWLSKPFEKNNIHTLYLPRLFKGEKVRDCAVA